MTAPTLNRVSPEGECYWDGGLISNTPLQWVVDYGPRQDTLTFQVDLWSARGELPRNLAEVATRQKEIQYSSRTRAKTDQFKRMQQMRRALAGLLAGLPENLLEDDEVNILNAAACHKVYNIVHLIYRTKNYEGHAKDFEFFSSIHGGSLARRAEELGVTSENLAELFAESATEEHALCPVRGRRLSANAFPKSRRGR